jgi:hypothetical protein
LGAQGHLRPHEAQQQVLAATPLGGGVDVQDVQRTLRRRQIETERP